MSVESTKDVQSLFRLDGRVAIITGGAGMLGLRHAEAIAEAGGIPVLVDKDHTRSESSAAALAEKYGCPALGIGIDITVPQQVADGIARVVSTLGRLDILINNAALTVKQGGTAYQDYFAPFESYPLNLFDEALRVNLTGAFLVTQVCGRHMAQKKKGVVINIASDVALISPDHRIYEGMTFEGKPLNTPVAYSISKAGLLAFTRYLATYWAPLGIRVNALSPAGVYDGHEPEFVKRLSSLIPLGRMAAKDEYKGAILFLCSDASSFMTGANLVIDGGRTAW